MRLTTIMEILLGGKNLILLMSSVVLRINLLRLQKINKIHLDKALTEGITTQILFN